jgi:DNA repair exonuclease SbcCD ATPase subunit
MQNKIDSLTNDLVKLRKLNEQLQALNKNLANSSTRESELKKKVERQAAEIQILNEKQAESKRMIKQKDDAIKEAADLLEDISTNPELREMLYDRNSGKKYYIDNFSEDMQDVLKDLITNYYSK